MIGKNLIAAAGNGISTGYVAEAIDFDGTNDTVYRSTLTGLADGKTFTFSAWVWLNTTGGVQIFNVQSGSINIFVSANILYMQISSTSGGTRSITLETSTAQIPLNTWVNILYSANLTGTTTRRLYINDNVVSPTYVDYNNTNIDWTITNFYVGGDSAKWNGRLSNVYLDFTYRDLTDVANRRLFVTADLKPADGQASLNPILYLPLNDPTAPGANAGTGGNFTLTGTVARSGRGPNQYNAPYSDLDGSADYLSRTTAPTGIADGKQGTFACTFNVDATSLYVITSFSSSTSLKFIVKVGSGDITVEGYEAGGTQVFALSQNAQIKVNRNYVLVLSFDTSDSNKYHLYVNGVQATTYFTVYTSGNIDYAITTTPRYYIGANATPSAYFNGRLGALWFNTSYIDLSVAANRAKFVTGTGIDAKPVDLGATGELPTGTSPLIYLPMYGNNAGKNYGTGGDFTVNSGPYTGARGPNEFWGNRADFNGTTGRLTKSTALTGVSDGKTVSGSFSVMFDNTSTNVRILSEATGSSSRLLITRTVGNALVIGIFNSSGGDVVNVSTVAGIFSSGVQYSVQFCFDVTNTAKRKVYINSEDMTLSVSAYNNQDMVFSGDTWTFGALYTGTYSQFLDGKLSEFYLTTDYIDFSQEANRLKFRDAFGNPVDLTQQIEDAAIPNPAIYMRFPPTAFGTNSGTGGNFTVNGTITDGGQL